MSRILKSRSVVLVKAIISFLAPFTVIHISVGRENIAHKDSIFFEVGDAVAEERSNKQG